MTLALHGLFDTRVAGDDALLALARQRFEQADLAAEVYGGSAEALEHVLGFVPAGQRAPTVHLSRDLHVLREADRAGILALVRRFGSRVSGFVVHDRADLPRRLDEVERAAAQLSAALRARGSASLFVEYAAGVPVEQFLAVGQRLAAAEQVGLCVDVGHVGLAAVRRRFAELAPDAGTDVTRLGVEDPRLPRLVGAVDEAVRAGLPAVEALLAALGPTPLPVHLHVHDAHPLVPGLSDHFPFQWRLPLPFPWRGVPSLPTLFGVPGLARILRAATAHVSPDRLSVTLEIHQGYGRRDLDPRLAGLFGHWADLTNAERQNGWLTVVTEAAALVRGLLALDAAPASVR